MSNAAQNNRIQYVDVLRVIAAFAVVVIHVCDRFFSETDLTGLDWNVMNFYDSLSRFAVPVFVMISGALFLNPDRELSIKKLYSKNILRIVTAFVFWSAIYAFVTAEGTGERVNAFLKGPTHFWYVFVVVGLYICTPILREIAKDDKLLRYFLIAAFVTAVLIPCVLEVVSFEPLDYVYKKAQLKLFSGYSGYFLLGYYLSKLRLKKRYMLLFAAAGIGGFVVTVIGTRFFSLRNGTAFESLYSNFTPNVLAQGIAVFMFVRMALEKREFREDSPVWQTIGFFAKNSFGIYLIHILVLSLTERYLHFTAMSFSPILSVPILALSAFLLSCAVSFCLKKIPIVNRYIV